MLLYILDIMDIYIYIYIYIYNVKDKSVVHKSVVNWFCTYNPCKMINNMNKFVCCEKAYYFEDGRFF